MANQHSNGATHEELLSANLVDEEQGRDRGQDVNDSHHASGKQRNGIIRKAKVLEYDRCVVDDRVNTYFTRSVSLLEHQIDAVGATHIKYKNVGSIDA